MNDFSDLAFLRDNFVERWRGSLDNALLEDARKLLDLAVSRLKEGNAAEAAPLARSSLLMAVTASEACLTDSLEIALEWAGDSQTDVPAHLRFGPSYDAWIYLTKRVKGSMSFQDKLYLGFQATFGETPCSRDTMEAIEQARTLRNRLAHLHSLRAHPLHEVLFSPERVTDAAAEAVGAVESLIEEMDSFFHERWKLTRGILEGIEEEPTPAAGD